MNTQQSANEAQEPKSETSENKATYRAPRLVALGSAESLVQGTKYGNWFDPMSQYGRVWR